MNFYYNQAMLAHLVKVSPNTVSRAAQSLGIGHLEDQGSARKYDLVSTAKITDFLFASNHRPVQQKTQVFYNFKGGTGKTSICYQMATHLALLGFKVLALDLDPQGHLSNALQVQEDWDGPTIYDVLIHDIPLSDALLSPLPLLDLLPANIAMTRIEVPLSTKTKREEKLKILLDSYRSAYDFIIIDTNPTISTLNMNALVASDRINIVCETQPFSLAGLRVLINEIISFFDDMGQAPNFCIIPNKYEIKTATAQEVLGALRSEYGNYVVGSIVRKSEEINISAKKRIPVSAFCKARSAAFEDVMDLLHELVEVSMKLPVKES